MKSIFITLLFAIGIVSGNCQFNRVFSGGEVMNFNDVSISLKSKIAWSTDRSSHPGYFCLSENSCYIGYSDKANIDGYIKKYGNTPFVFPVGTGKDLRTLEISKPSNPSDAYATAWIEGNPSYTKDPTLPNEGVHSVYAVAEPIYSVSTKGQWDWQVGANDNLGLGTTGDGAGLTITVSMPDLTQFGDATDLRLVGWNGEKWIDLSGKASAIGNNEDCTLSGIMKPGITSIAIGRTAPISFIKLKNIEATTSNCNTILNWETTFETPESNFIIEQSLDGINFYSVAACPSSASSTGNYYSQTLSQKFGLAYYRLKVSNSNGKYFYSDTVTQESKCKEINHLELFPNPVTDNQKIYIQFSSTNSCQAKMMIFNAIGQLVFEKAIKVNQGINFHTPDIKNLKRGKYFIQLLGSNNEQISASKEFIKQ